MAADHGDPRNVRGNGPETEEEQLFRIVLDSLVYEGYRGMTLKAIKERCEGVDVQAVLSRYRTKEDVCRAALEDGKERMALIYEGVTAEARDYLETGVYSMSAGGLDKERGGARRKISDTGQKIAGLERDDEGWKQLERLLYRHIYQCFHPKNRIYVLAAAQESQLPEELEQILPDALWKYFGSVLAQLVYQVGQVKNAQVAAMCACTVCGGINAFVQQPLYCKNVFMGQTGREPNYAVIEDLLNDHFLRAIAADTAIDKAF